MIDAKPAADLLKVINAVTPEQLTAWEERMAKKRQEEEAELLKQRQHRGPVGVPR